MFGKKTAIPWAFLSYKQSYIGAIYAHKSWGCGPWGRVKPGLEGDKKSLEGNKHMSA